MRERVILVLDSAGIALLVVAAGLTWGLGAGLAALGAGFIVISFYIGDVAPRRKRSP